MENFILKEIKIKLFRNLKDLSPLKFSRRINVISGQNGVGKSTILALICSGTGSKEFRNPKSKSFQPDFQKYFMIYPEETQPSKGGDDTKRYYVYSTYERERDSLKVTKRLRLKNNHGSQDKRIQIIPTTYVTDNELSETTKANTKTDYIKYLQSQDVSAAGRLPVPTFFNSISRAYPLGELGSLKNPTNEATFDRLRSDNLVYKNELNKFYADSYNSVLPDSIDPDAEAYYYSKRNVAKNEFSMPIQNTRPLSRSVGQDALGTMVSTLTDFKYLQKTNENYSGGILCIDEVDVALHPAAQKKLLALLYRCAINLNLQIFITTHSMTMLEEACRKAITNSEEYSVNYLYDRYHPRLLKDATFENIKADLQLSGTITRPVVQTYFEDEISLKVHKLLLDAAKQLKIPVNPKQVNVNNIALKGGKDFIRTVYTRDPYFQTTLIILDADARFSSHEQQKKPIYISDYILKDYSNSEHTDVQEPGKNFMRLPGYFAPESYLYRIIQRYSVIEQNEALQKENQYFWTNVEDTTGYIATTAQYIHQNWTITKDKYTNNDIKKIKKTEEIVNFLDQSKALAFYYSFNQQRKDELKQYIDKYNTLLLQQEKRIAASRF